MRVRKGSLSGTIIISSLGNSIVRLARCMESGFMVVNKYFNRFFNHSFSPIFLM
jgi:hypothetical protein